MAIEDNPVQPAGQTIEDNPISPSQSTAHSKPTESFMAAQASFMDSYITGNSVLDNYRYYSGVINKAQELQRLAQEKSTQDSNDLTEDFVANPYGATGSIQEQAEAIQTAIEQVTQQAVNPDKQAAEAMLGDSIELDKVDREAALAKMYKMLSDVQGGISGVDVAMDFGKALLPWISTWEGYHLTGDVFGQDEEIKKAIAAFQNLPAEEQLEMFPHIRDELIEEMGEVGAAETLTNFLAPLGAENPQRYGDIDTAFDLWDATGVGFATGAALTALRKSFNAPKSMAAMGNTQGAADVTTAALMDSKIAEGAGMTQDTALGNALPYDISIEDISHQGGLSGDILDNLRGFFNQADQLSQDIMAGNGFLKEGAFNTRERAELEAEAISKLKAEQAENITVASREGPITKFKYSVRDEDGNLTEEEFELELTLNDAGFWDQSEGSLIAEYLASSTVYAKGKLREDVDVIQNIDYLNARLNNQLHKLQREALRPIGLLPTPKNRASLARVDKALVAGDEWKNPETGQRGKVFDVEDLRRDYGLDENEVSAYYRLNRLYNNIFNIRNNEVRQEMQLRQYKNVNLERSGESLIGRPFETSQDAALSVREGNINYVYDADADELIDIKTDTSGTLSRLYDENKMIVRTDRETPYDIGGDRGKVYYLAVSREDIGELPQTVLHRKEGYVPRIYDEAVYFVKELFDTTVDGDKPFKQSRTRRFFDNKKDAEAYIETLVRAEVSDIQDPVQRAKAADKAREKYITRTDREEEILSAAAGEAGHGFGGLYTGARAQDDILFGLNGDKPSRLNSFESLTRNIGNLSKFVSLNQWRLGMEQKWINTANRILSAKGIDRRVTNFERMPSIAEASGEVRFLNKMYDQIRDWQHFPTAEERAWDASVRKIYDFAMDTGFRRTAKFLGNFRSTDPIAVARATAFHSFLGWFNLAQLWVQSQGMAQAFALGAGKFAARSMSRTIAFTALDSAGTKADSIMKLMAKSSNTSEDELRTLYDLWNKTGYKDSVLQTADHAAASKGYGMSMEAFRRVADLGLIPYRNGELLNRRMSFHTSVERWLEKNAGKTVNDIDDDALKAIMIDANNMMLGMTKANRAQWQKGVLSLPFQFLQVTTKFLETSIGLNRNFTPAERGKLIAAQLLLYGTAGIPAVNYVNSILTNTLGITQQDIENNPKLVKAWNDGFWGVTSYWILGADIELASRGSILRGVSQFTDDWFIQESTIQEKLLGAFGSTQTRFWDSFVHNMKPFTLSESEVDWSDAGKLLVSPFIDTISSMRNIKKAMYMNRLNAVYSRRGRLIDTRDYSFTEEMAQAVGFQQTPEAETWDLSQMNRASDELKQDITDYVIKEMNAFAFSHPEMDYTDEEFAEYMDRIKAATAVLDPDEALELRKAIDQSVTSGSRRSREIQRALKNVKETTTDELLNWRSTLVGSKVLRIGLETEEEE